MQKRMAEQPQPMVQQPPPQQQMRMLQVQVPPNVMPGQAIQVSTPNGGMMQVQVPLMRLQMLTGGHVRDAKEPLVTVVTLDNLGIYRRQRHKMIEAPQSPIL